MEEMKMVKNADVRDTLEQMIYSAEQITQHVTALKANDSFLKDFGKEELEGNEELFARLVVKLAQMSNVLRKL